MMLSKILGLVLLAFATACGTTTSSVSPTEGVESASDDLAASPESVPIVLGQLTPGVRYLLDTDPVISIEPDTEWGASPAPGGIALISGQTTLRILTGVEEAYVEGGGTEPIAQDAAGILEQLRRNNRTTITDAGEMQFGGETVGYVDMESVVDPIEAEGGTLILQVSGQSVRLADHFVNRVMVVPAEPAPIVVIVSGTEQSGLEQTLADVDSLLGSVRVEE